MQAVSPVHTLNLDSLSIFDRGDGWNCEGLGADNYQVEGQKLTIRMPSVLLGLSVTIDFII